MPITITVKDFKKQTYSRFYDRPLLLCLVDRNLADYHRAKINPASQYLLICVELIVDHIEEWAQGKAQHTVKGVQCYRDYRDRHGIITQLLQQAQITLREIRQARAMAAQNAQNARTPPPLPPRPVPKTFGPTVNLSRASGSSFDSEPYRPFSLGEHFGRPPSEISFNRPSSAVGSDYYHEDAFFQNVRQLPPLPSLRIHDDGYEAAALLVRSVRHITRDQVRDADRQLTQNSPLPISSGLVFHALYKALESMGFNVFHEQHCNINHLSFVLDAALPQNPVLLCVGNGHTQNRVIICYGQRYTGTGANQEPSYLVSDTRTGPQAAGLFRNGDFEVIIGTIREHYQILPTLGYIKLRR